MATDATPTGSAGEPEATKPGLRERKNRRTRLAIVRATAELTVRDGYAAATIARIAERADVSARTVSTWFPAKDDILFEGAEEEVARGVRHLRSDVGDIADRLLAWFTQESEAADQGDIELARLRTQAIMRDPELRARYRQIFERLQLEVAKAVARDAGAAVGDMGPRLMGGAAMAFLERLAELTLEEPTDAARAQMATGLEFLRAGMRVVGGTAS